MRATQKRSEPSSLTQHKRLPHADYDNYHHKDELRFALVAEQKGICCYCMQRIRPNAAHMKIEHWHCQALYPNDQLDYANLLGACRGNEGQPKYQQHCDTHKGNDSLLYNPANPAHRIEDRVRYLGDGRIVSSDSQFDQELNTVLNLNIRTLINNRKATLDAFKQRLQRGRLSQSTLQRMMRNWSDAEGEGLRPYCGVVIYWLRKRLARG